MTLYTDEIRKILHTAPIPKKMRLDVIEFDTHILLTMYRDDLITLNDEEHERLKRELRIARNKIKLLGVVTGVELR